MTPTTHRHLRRSAFTLVEAISAIVVLSVLAGVASGLMLQSVDRYTEASVRSQLHAEASVALDRIARAMRAVDVMDTGSGPRPRITSLTPDSIDYNGNCGIQLSAGRIMLTDSGGTPAPLLEDVTSLTIQARDESDAPLGATLVGAQCAPIRRIRVSLTVRRRGVAESLSARVFLRGVMTGAGV